jgi:hypothetical protein
MMMRCTLRAVLFLPLFVALTVSFAGAQSLTRVEQNDPSVISSGNLYSNTNTANTGGLATLTNTKGARASLTFTGSGISWLGVSDGWAGVATVYVDGVMTIVDTYSNVSYYQRTIFTARGLGTGPHTISIEVMHERGPGTEGSWVWIDAFDIEGGAPIPGGITASAGRVEDSNAALVYTGRWYSKESPAYSGGTAVLAMDPGFRITINFKGTGVSWIGYRDEWSGVARVYVDGEAKTTVDNYQSPSVARALLYSIGGLSPGPHSLTIEVTGTRNSSAKGAWVWVDAFDVVP